MKRSTLNTLAIFAALLAAPLAAADDKAMPAAANSLGMKFVRVPAGEYIRGFETSNQRERRFDIVHQYSNKQNVKLETPAHRTVISKPLEIGVTEVTVGQFREFVVATNYKTDAERNGGALGCFPAERNYVDRFHKSPEITWKSPGFPQTDDHPVVAVSWNDAQKFCEWLSKEEKATYRLPSEAEWEWACRAGQQTWYSWGEAPNDAYEHANVADGALEAAQPKTTRFQRAVRLGADEGDGAVFTAKTASYKPNAWGLYDMHGNVWEWCQDRWSADVYERYFDGVPRQQRSKVVVRDPLFLDKTDQHQYGDWRSMRGGAWTCAPPPSVVPSAPSPKPPMRPSTPVFELCEKRRKPRIAPHNSTSGRGSLAIFQFSISLLD